MVYLIAILVGLALIGVVIAGAFAFLASIAKGVADTKNEFVLWLGRKGLGAKAVIPKELAEKTAEKEQSHRGYRYGTLESTPEFPSPLPPKDADAAALRAYRPKARIPRPLRSFAFNETIERVFQAGLSEPSRSIDIDRVGDLLAFESKPSYLALFESIGAQPAYPGDPPEPQQDIPPPPQWTPWHPVLGEPSFTPPHYGPKLAFLNRFVDAAYREETRKVQVAMALREDLLARCAKRNAEVAGLAENAKRLYESEAAKQRAAHDLLADDHAKAKAAFEEAFLVEQH